MKLDVIHLRILPIFIIMLEILLIPTLISFQYLMTPFQILKRS